MAKVTKRPNYQKIDGLLLPPFSPESIREVLDYKPKPGDIFIVTYPKCGTTWMQMLALYIFRKGKELEDYDDFRVYCPFIECTGICCMENMPRPGAFKTHLPFTHVPYSPDAKYIYVIRNPKDCCVSMYYHTAHPHDIGYADATFDEFFEIFMAGEVEYNDYFDHLMSWYPHLKDENVFFTTYEEMKEDTKTVVLKLASFLGDECREAIEKDNTVLDNILRLSRFDHMKKHMSEVFKHGPKCKKHKGCKTNHGCVRKIEETKLAEQPPKAEKVGHLRKGIVGDWKNHFSEEQNERMNKKFTERTQGTEIYDMYKSYMFA